MLEMGLVVGIALLFTMSKMSWPWKLRMLSNPFVVDIIVFALLCLIHWGTFSGVMVATIGAMMCSLVLSAGRKAYGYKDANGDYIRGYYDITSKLAS